jgi:hypothetical protein
MLSPAYGSRKRQYIPDAPAMTATTILHLAGAVSGGTTQGKSAAVAATRNTQTGSWDVITLSFIVPAYNEERGLSATLDAIRHAASVTGEPYEVIVVDDASTDQTSAVAASRGATIVRVAHRQIAAARNAGARAATGDLLFFVDADTTQVASLRTSLQAP